MVSNVCDLQTALGYSHNAVVHHFLKSYRLPLEEAEDLFGETKKWLWLCATRAWECETGLTQMQPLVIHQALILLDEMWHTFVLFTRDYRHYCQRVLGTMVDHVPTTRDQMDRDELRQQTDPASYQRDFENQMRAQMSYIYDKLGEDTLRKWYEDYPQRYDPAFLKSVYVRWG